MTLAELIQRAVDVATLGVAGPELRLAMETAAEPLLSVVFGDVGDELAAIERTRSLLRRTKTLVVADGTVELPDDVLTAYLSDSVLYDADDTTKRYSLVQWDELVRGELDSRLGHYAMEGESTLRVVEPANTYDPNAGADIELRLAIPCSPAVPALPSDQVDVNDEVLDILIKRLALALKPTMAR